MRNWTPLAFVLLLAGCSVASSHSCPPASMLSIDGYSTGSAPDAGGLPIVSGKYPTASTYVYFSTSQGSTGPQLKTVTGVPILKGSDGSTISGGGLTPVFAVDVTPILLGYASSVSELKSNLTYSVSFASLTGNPSGCAYGGQSSGSFQTQ